MIAVLVPLRKLRFFCDKSWQLEDGSLFYGKFGHRHLRNGQVRLEFYKCSVRYR
jgi:hypothetical protein